MTLKTEDFYSLDAYVINGLLAAQSFLAVFQFRIQMTLAIRINHFNAFGRVLHVAVLAERADKCVQNNFCLFVSSINRLLFFLF